MMDKETILQKQRAFFGTGKTIPLPFRKEALKRLAKTILGREQEIYTALRKDLNKSETESYLCEIGLVLSEISYLLKHIDHWAKKKYVLPSLAQIPAVPFTVKEPYGVVLILSPWNYPFLLTMVPLAGAIAAGNCCVVKPSAYAPATSACIARILQECFKEEYVAVVEGGREENQSLLEQKFDYIFFTGGTAVGREVMAKAARHLTPLTLELGGKSPCIVDKTANLDLAAKKIVFGKFLNGGQTCVAPDYILAEKEIKDSLIRYMKKWIVRMYGKNPLENEQYVKMIHPKHFDRVKRLIIPEKVVFGGGWNEKTMQIQPTILDGVTAEDAVMQEEIFGPVIPIITVEDMQAAERFIREREKPLALYLFTENKKTAKRFLRFVSFGGGCINDTVIHLATSRMGFGGVGASGMGSYHGKKSFETFSHEKSIVNQCSWLDVPMRYAPYQNWQKCLIRLLLR